MRRLGRMCSAWLLAAVALLLPGLASAQAPACTVPGALPASHGEGATLQEPRRVLPVGGYTLALSWSPEYCHRRRGSEKDSFQCGGANRFGFTLHGLWPDGQGREWPQYCRASAPVPDAVLRAGLCATPSVQLMQHEWAKHGTCMSADPARYFARSTALYRGLAFPDMDALSRRKPTARLVQAAFARANPGMRPEMVRVNANRRGWLEELWLCLDVEFRPRACPLAQGGAAPDSTVSIWRGGRGDPADRRPRYYR